MGWCDSLKNGVFGDVSTDGRSESRGKEEELPDGEGIYRIPMRYRRVENLHILLWLMKDACWALGLKWAGVFMIFPTLTVAVLITWQTRRFHSEWLHNLAVDFWILANCTWMVGEFFGWDEGVVGEYGLRQLSLLPFGAGLMILGWYYFGGFFRGGDDRSRP